MGTSTDGQICYGVLIEEGTLLPWDNDEYDGDIEDWWIYGVLGFKHSFEIYDKDGNFIDGVQPSQEKLDAYYSERRKFEEQNEKLPVELVNCCSGDYPMWIIALPRTIINAKRGYPESFNPAQLKISNKEKELLFAFCKKFKIEMTDVPRWWLSSYWG